MWIDTRSLLRPRHAHGAYPAKHWRKVVKPGDHLVVPLDIVKIFTVYHHGLYVGDGMVVDFCDERRSAKGKLSTKLVPAPQSIAARGRMKLCMRPVDGFFVSDIFYIVPYTYNLEVHYLEDEDTHRQQAINFAKLLMTPEFSDTVLHSYDLLEWNCESFVWACRTQGFKHDSDQVNAVFRRKKPH